MTLKQRPAIPRILERRLYKEAGNLCCHCGEPDIAKLAIHHIIPFSENLTHDPQHMLVLCANCHALATRGEVDNKALYLDKARVTTYQRKTGLFPNNQATQNIKVEGIDNIVAGRDINIRVPSKKVAKGLIIPGTVAEDKIKIGYLNHLIDRYNEFKERECKTKGIKMNYAMIRVAYKREMKFSVKDTPIELFEKAMRFLHRRIVNTQLGRIKRAKGQSLYSSFEEFVEKTIRPE